MKLRDLTNVFWGSTTPKSRNEDSFRKPKVREQQQHTQTSIPQFFPSRKRINNEDVSPSEVNAKRRKEALKFDHDDGDIPACARSLHRAQSFNVLQSSASWEDSFESLSPNVFEHYSLRVVEKPQIANRAFKSISGDTLCQLLTSMTEEQFRRKFILIDCRYPYEFNGGHIQYAVNVFDVNKLSDIFYPANVEEFERISSKIPIFYCEFSQKRGPAMASELRNHDRKRNEHNYPDVDYKEIYLVDHGYQKFFLKDKFVDFCHPCGYVPMINKNFAEELKKYRFHQRGRSSQSSRFRPSKQCLPLTHHSSLQMFPVGGGRTGQSVAKSLFNQPSTPENGEQSELFSKLEIGNKEKWLSHGCSSSGQFDEGMPSSSENFSKRLRRRSPIFDSILEETMLVDEKSASFAEEDLRTSFAMRTSLSSLEDLDEQLSGMFED